MATETINEVISQEAFEQIKKLRAELEVLNQQMNENIANVDKFNKAMNGSSSAKETANNINNVNSASETLAKTTQKTITKQKELKDETDRVSAALRESQNNLKTHAAQSGNAGDKLQTLQRQIRQIRNELSGEMLAMTQLNIKIKEQTALTNQLAQTKGKESKEYQKAKIELDKLTESQTISAKSIQELQTQGGKLQDIYGDASKRIRALSSDFANTDAAVQGVGVMIDAYTVLQSTMVGLGIESDQLMDIFAKLMILQQGVNSVSQITKALQSESILRTKLEAAQMVIKNAYQKRLLAAQIANNAATGAGNIATGASIGIFKKAKIAVQAMNEALMKNPFILLAIAIIAAVAALAKFIANQKAERVELLNKAIDQQTKSLRKNKEQLDRTVSIMETWGVNEEQILKYKKAQIYADLIQARSLMHRVKANKDATTEQKNSVTEAYNEQVKLYNDLNLQIDLYNIKKRKSDAQAAVDAVEKTKEENAKKAEENKKAWEKKLEEERKFAEQLSTDIKKIEYDKMTALEKLRSDMLDVQTWREEQLKEHPRQRAEIEELYLLKIEKLRADFHSNENNRIENVKSRTLEAYKIIAKTYEEMAKMYGLQEENELNQLIIDGVEDAESEKLRIIAKYAAKERSLFENQRDELIKNGMTQEEYTNKLLQFKADEVQAVEAANDRQIQSEQLIAEARKQAAMQMVGNFEALGTAIAQNIKEEKKRMKVEASIALVQALVNEGIAIAEAINDKGGPYTKAIRIAANVAAITAAMVTATAAFRQANAAMPYAEGTDYHKGGDAIVGERYEPELVLMKNKPLIVDKPTFFKDMPIGTKVIPFSKMENGNNMMSMEETNELLRAIKEKQTVSINVSDRVTSFINSKLGYTKILNSKFKA